MPEAFEPGDESFGHLFRIAFADVVAAEVDVERSGMVAGAENAEERAPDGAERFL